MIDERFSRSAFEALGIDSAAARSRADELAAEIQSEFQSQLLEYSRELVSRLNSLGHELSIVEHVGGEDLGGVSYRDEAETPGRPCKLRVALDFTVSTGYAHLLSADEIDAKYGSE